MDGFIIVYKEQLKARLHFSLDAFYVDVLTMNCCSVAQFTLIAGELWLLFNLFVKNLASSSLQEFFFPCMVNSLEE